MMQNEGENFEYEGENFEYEDEEEEPIFVLTDEWRDFFAKSEAKRRQGIFTISFFFNCSTFARGVVSSGLMYLIGLQRKNMLRRKGKVRSQMGTHQHWRSDE